MVDLVNSASKNQATEHRPKHAITEAENVPLIDLSAESNLVAEIRDASKKWGFFQVVNHGVSQEVRRSLESAAKEFFALSAEEKGKVKRDEINSFGYYDSEHTKNVRDWKEVIDIAVQSPITMPVSHDPDDHELKERHNRWPEYPPNFREACQEYALELQNLALRLLQLIFKSLGLPENHLNGFFKDQTSFIRINHYPPCPTPDLSLGVGPHKDAGAITILAQDDNVAGLEVKRKADGAWIRVEPVPDAYIVNLGDIMQVWANEIYESVEHRVRVNSERERFSIVFFVAPAHYVNVEPWKELIDDQNPAKYRPFNWGKFYATRKRSNFKKLNVENIQISHFKIAAAE